LRPDVGSPRSVNFSLSSRTVNFSSGVLSIVEYNLVKPCPCVDSIAKCCGLDCGVSIKVRDVSARAENAHIRRHR
jgi:hypothetical protein